jgi:hypothetical protein
LNVAIDHSLSEQCTVEVRLDAVKLGFTVRNTGIGVLYSIGTGLVDANPASYGVKPWPNERSEGWW